MKTRSLFFLAILFPGFQCLKAQINCVWHQNGQQVQVATHHIHDSSTVSLSMEDTAGNRYPFSLEKVELMFQRGLENAMSVKSFEAFSGEKFEMTFQVIPSNLDGFKVFFLPHHISYTDASGNVIKMQKLPKECRLDVKVHKDKKE